VNTLSMEKKIAAISLLVEGNSIRSIERVTGVHRDTIMRLVVRTGEACSALMDRTMRRVHAKLVQVDEIWTYCYVKEKRMKDRHNPMETGDQYVFVAIDAETKLVPSFVVGKRNAENAYYLMQDLQGRLAHRVQLTTDGFRPYLEAVEGTFGADVDYSMLVKIYGSSKGEGEGPAWYGPAEVVSTLPIPIMGEPDPKLISTSYVERQNLTIRMQLRRFTRLTNAFSKKLPNLKAAVALHFAHYNFVRIHQSLRVTPSMAAGVTHRLWTVADLLGQVSY
jgi:IS1 family transposase